MSDAGPPGRQKSPLEQFREKFDALLIAEVHRYGGIPSLRPEEMQLRADVAEFLEKERTESAEATTRRQVLEQELEIAKQIPSKWAEALDEWRGRAEVAEKALAACRELPRYDADRNGEPMPGDEYVKAADLDRVLQKEQP